MELFQPALAPEVGMGKRVAYTVHEAQFGEGYATRLSVINNKGQTLDLSFGLLTQSQADDIEDFLDARAGADAFLYAAPGFGGMLPWVCKEWSREHQGLWFRIAATFVRVFDVASLSGGGGDSSTGITVLRQTAAQWSSENPLLDDGVFGIEVDTDLYKIGNGVSVWTSLPYMRAPLPGNRPVAHVEQRTAAAWRSFDPIMSDQTIGYEIDTHRAKIGDGSTRWLNLPYLVTDGDSFAQAYAALSGGNNATRTPDLILDGGRGPGRAPRDLLVDAGSSATRVLI